VRNNIETIPGWGSYQNSELTLGARRGNPFDVASLTIALLRAAGIPSRYVMGAVDVDPDRYTNWIGDFENADVASDYAVANGIAIAVVSSGGQTNRIRTQHVWVQAAIDYFPSRGAKNLSADVWVDLDPSFKQYEYLEGLDVAEIAGIDIEALTNQFIESGTVDEGESFVQNLDANELLAAQEQTRQAVQEHIEQNLTDPTVGDTIGGRRTIVKEYPTLPSGLPYTKFNEGLTFGTVPSTLQNKVSIGFNNNRQTFPFAVVNNEKITLQFTPATQADEDALAALIPEGEITDETQLPSSISSSIAALIPEITFNGEVIVQDNPIRIGNEINLTYQISGPNATYAPYNYSVIAGSYLNIPLIAQSVSSESSRKLLIEVLRTQSVIETGNQSQIENLSRDKALGDLYYAGGLSYWAQSIGLGHVSSAQNNGSTKLEFGYGSFGYEPQLNTFFGVPRGIERGGIGVNMLFAVTAESNNGDTDMRNQLRLQAGLISSALEHSVPEQMFSDPSNPSQAVSAVKALQIALNEGQRIYTIDSSNLNLIMPQLNLDFSIEQEIRASVTAGRIVMTHTNNVTVPGVTIAGYIILDPDTLLGSYKISGGFNGGQMGIATGIAVGGLLASSPAAIGVILASPVFQALILAVIAQLLILAAFDLFQGEGNSVDCFVVGFLNGLGLGLGVAAVAGLPFSAVSGQILGFIGIASGLSLLNGGLPGVVECGIDSRDLI